MDSSNDLELDLPHRKLARPPPFLRTQSSPSPPTNASRALQPASLADTFLSTLPVPVLVFTPSLRLHSINEAGQSAFGILDGAGVAGLGGAEQFFFTSAGLPGSTPLEKIRQEFSRMASSGTTWGNGDCLELRSVSGVRWRAEATVRSFVPPATPTERHTPSLDTEASRHWYSVVLLRQIPVDINLSSQLVSRPLLTRQVLSNGSLDLLDLRSNTPNHPNEHDDTPAPTPTLRSTNSDVKWPIQDDSSEGGWAHAVPATPQPVKDASAPSPYEPTTPLASGPLPTPLARLSSSFGKRPTALPPPLPTPRSPTPDLPQLLQLATWNNLPKTGVIFADSTISSGFVNGVARELLMGVPASTEHGSSEEWWKSGYWSTEDTWSAASANSQQSGFFSNLSSGSSGVPTDLLYSSIIKAGEATYVDRGKGTANSGIRIGPPAESNRYRTTVANILARSLEGEERRRFGLSPGGLPSASSSASFAGVGNNAGKKPYKVYDSTFSRRIIDPLEPLLATTASQGQQPPSFDKDADEEENLVYSGMTIGVEVEVWESSAGSLREGFRDNSTAKRAVRRRVIEVTAAPLFAPNPSPGGGNARLHLGGVLILQDVTNDARRSESRDEPKRTKKATGDAYFKHILDHLPQMVWTTTPLGSHTFFNTVWYQWTGLEPEQSLGLGWQNPFHEDDMPAAIKAWSHSLETGDPYSIEYRCRRADGKWFWMLGRALPLRNVDGVIQGWFGTCTDIHDFIQIRKDAEKRKEQFNAIISGAEALIWAMDLNWTCTFFRGSERKFFESQIGAIEGKNIKELWPESALIAPIQQILDGVVPSARIDWLPGTFKTSTWRCQLTPLTEVGADGVPLIKGVIVVATDVTDLNLAHEQLRASFQEKAKIQASETAANEANRLKTEFVANLSHELRSPVAGMIGLAELLLDETDLSESHRTTVKKLFRAGEHLLELVGMVLDLQKIEANRLDLENRRFSLDDLISDTRLFSVAAHKKGLLFKEDYGGGAVYGGPVLGDMPRLRQVLANLLSNAVKFTDQGSVTLRVKQRSQSTHHVVISFEVQDTGVGIRKEVIPLLFSPFHQADASTARRFGGTGLGLVISKKMIELMGGTIQLESEFGKGTCMTVVVPLEKAPSELSDVQGPVSSLPERDLVREDTWILVTDDNELNREIITRQLTRMRFNVETAINGLEAVNAVQRRNFDLILMDCQMDTLDGYEATQTIRKLPDPSASNVKIIALTASAIQGDEEKARASGMDGYLTKPVRQKVLEATILQHLAPLPPTRRSSGSRTPAIDTAAMKGIDFSPFFVVDESLAGNSTGVTSRRKLSHPSYSPPAAAGLPLLPGSPTSAHPPK